MQSNDKNLSKIKTAHYDAQCTSNSIRIEWNNGLIDQYDESSLNVPNDRIYEYSPEEILYHYNNDIHYANITGDKKIILKNIQGDIYYYKKYGKLVVVEDHSDPPDNVFIFSIKKLLKCSADLNKKDDRKKYHIISFSEWESNIHHDSKYLYVSTENGLTKINIQTNKITEI